LPGFGGGGRRTGKGKDREGAGPPQQLPAAGDAGARAGWIPKVAARGGEGGRLAAVLLKEMQEHQKDAKAAAAQVSSITSKRNPTPEATVDAILAALTRTLGSEWVVG